MVAGEEAEEEATAEQHSIEDALRLSPKIKTLLLRARWDLIIHFTVRVTDPVRPAHPLNGSLGCIILFVYTGSRVPRHFHSAVVNLPAS